MNNINELLKKYKGEGDVSLSDNIDLQNDILSFVATAQEASAKDSATKEKAKLYSQIEEQKKLLAAMAAKQTNSTDNNVAQPTITGNSSMNNASNNASQRSEVNIEEIVAQRVAALFNERLPDLLTSRLDPYMKTIKELQAESVEAYKSRIISENKDNIYSEIITGTSKAAIDTSLTLAKEVFLKYNVGKPLSAPNGSNVQPTNTNIAQPMTGQIPDSTTYNELSAEAIKNLSPEEFRAQRATLLKKAAGIL